MNISGAAIAKHAPNKANAQKLLEYLVSNDAQALYAQANYEYPVEAARRSTPIIAAFGTLKPDSLDLVAIARHRKPASKLVDKVGFDNSAGQPIGRESLNAMSVTRASARRSDGGGWTLAALLVAAIVLAPIVALFAIAAQGSGDLWPHLLAYVLPQAVHDTALLLLGVGVVTVVVGAGTAWLVTAYGFPGRGFFDWALLLPLAVPTYIVAFAYLDLLHPLGPVQTALRALLAIDRSARAVAARRPLAARLHSAPGLRALSLCLSRRARDLPDAIGARCSRSRARWAPAALRPSCAWRCRSPAPPSPSALRWR